MLSNDQVIDAIALATETENIVMSGEKRAYNQFKVTSQHGGSITAYALGCNLRCVYCWCYDLITNLVPTNFYSPLEVARKLVGVDLISKRRFRISGSEPILGEKSLKHIISIIEHLSTIVSEKFEFFIETNGIILDQYPELLSIIPSSDRGIIGVDVKIQVSLKSWDEESFNQITGCRGFSSQISTIRRLKTHNIPFSVIVLKNILEKHKDQIVTLIGNDIKIETESLMLTSEIMDRLMTVGLNNVF